MPAFEIPAENVEENDNTIITLDASKIFHGFRSLGLVANHIPLVSRYMERRKESLITTVIGATIHTYASSRLQLVSVGVPHSQDIKAVAADKFHTYTSVGNTIYAWKRGSELQKTYCEEGADVRLLLSFGYHLISVDEDNFLRVWDIDTTKLFLELSFGSTFRITTILHPTAYVNKILLGSENGALQLWNLRTAKQLHTFNGWGAPITVLTQTPAVDVVAVGLATGDIYIHNIKFDETLLRFNQDWGCVTNLAFRTDGPPIMISGSTEGHMAIWDLEEGKIVTQIRDGHRGPVTGMHCLPSEPILVTSSPDNSVKMWVFDQADGGARQLRIREGHSAPPTFIRFHGQTSENILSAGEDSTLRSFSTITDVLNKNFGQASRNRKKAKRLGMKNDPGKLPPIVRFDSEHTREKDWDCIAVCHRDMAAVTTWHYDCCRMGDHKLRHDRFKTNPLLKNAVATSVCVTACGNFVLIGMDSGHIDRFNIQSGLHRATYSRMKNDRAHDGSVVGVQTDAVDHIVISAGSDSQLQFWRFKKGEAMGTVQLDCEPKAIQLHRESGLLAVAKTNGDVDVVEVDTRQVVRRLKGKKEQIVDFAFSPDSRWLTVAGEDSSIRVWDLRDGSLIDHFLCTKPIVSITFSPTGDYVATAHKDDLGIYLWSNKTLFAHVALRPLEANHKPAIAALPGSRSESQQKSEGLVDETDFEMEVKDDEYKSPEQLETDLITLSNLPSSRWKHLLHIDAVRRRHKPKVSAKVKEAPFFLPTTGGLNPSFILPETNKEDDDSRLMHLGSFQPMNPLAKRLNEASTDEDLFGAIQFLKTLGPSAIDVEIRSLSPDLGGSEGVLFQFLEAVNQGLRKKVDFEVVQAYLSLYLKVHGPAVCQNKKLSEKIQSVLNQQSTEWVRLQREINSGLCLLSFMKHSVL